jgi:hypothetical protein
MLQPAKENLPMSSRNLAKHETMYCMVLGVKTVSHNKEMTTSTLQGGLNGHSSIVSAPSLGVLDPHHREFRG